MATPTDKQIAKPLMYCHRSITAWQMNAKFLTRRLAKPLPDKEDWKPYQDDQGRWWWLERRPRAGFRLIPMRQPYAVGDLLWIREALRAFHEPPGPSNLSLVLYDADGVLVHPVDADEALREWSWKRDKLPAMFMPRWACRYYARVVSRRPERLQDISDEDAVAEGTLVGIKFPTTWHVGKSRGLYLEWWDSMHKKPGTRSEDNPQVWVYGLEKADDRYQDGVRNG